MGVLRVRQIEDDVDELLEKDPYELFTLDEPRSRLHRAGRKLRPEAWGAVFLGVAAAFGVAFATFWNVQGGLRDDAEQPYAYLEVRAIDPDGRPVAGAVVRDGGDEPLGVTDSFGEWRRFMRVKPGSTVTLTLSKRTGGALLTAAKNLAVPAKLPVSGELELSGSVQLTRGGVVEPGAKVARAAGTPSRSVVAAATASDAEIAPLATAAREAQRESAMPTVVADTSEGLAPGGTRDAVTLAGDPTIVTIPADATAPAALGAAAPSADLARIWFSTPVTPPAPLAEVLGAAARRVRELGVRVEPESPWRLRFSHIEAPTTGSALVLVESFYGDRPQFSFLRNYQDAALQTARDILWAATLHVPWEHRAERRDGGWYLAPAALRLFALTPGRWLEGPGGRLVRVDAEGQELRLGPGADEACGAQAACALRVPGLARVAPVPGWQRLELKVLGPVTADTRIYVSGYQAAQEADGRFRYWGQPGGAANATVVRKGRVVLRARVDQLDRGGPTLSLPQPPLSRR